MSKVIKVRAGVFETNSSSTHTITMCTGSDYKKWENGELFYDRWEEELVTKEDIEKAVREDKNKFLVQNGGDFHRFLTWDEFFEDDSVIMYETYMKSLTTNSGETIYAFGYYGEN